MSMKLALSIAIHIPGQIMILTKFSITLIMNSKKSKNFYKRKIISEKKKLNFS